MVIFAHIQISYMIDNHINTASLVIKCLIGDNVPIFLLILGFFLFGRIQGENYGQKIPSTYFHKIRGFLIRVFIPTLIVTLIACFASKFVYKTGSFLSLFTNPEWHWEYMTDYILHGEPSDMVGHFWYIVVYIKVLFFFPLMSCFCNDQKNLNLARRIYMLASFGFAVLNDWHFLH